MKTLFASLLCVTLMFTSLGLSQTSGTDSSSATEKIRSKVKKYAESNKKVVVTSDFGDKSRGLIVRFDQNVFTVKDQKAGAEKTFQYAKVRSVNRSGGLSTTTIVTLAAVGAGAAIVLGLFVVRCRNEGGC